MQLDMADPSCAKKEALRSTHLPCVVIATIIHQSILFQHVLALDCSLFDPLHLKFILFVHLLFSFNGGEVMNS